MNRRTLFATALATTLGLSISQSTFAQTMDVESQATFDTVMAFMGAMGGGDMKKMDSLMADNMVWQNDGDPSLPWIGKWEGKQKIFGFLGDFSKNVQVTHWKNEDAFAQGDTTAVFGRMKLKLTKSGMETPEFSFALRAKVKDGKVVYWNWFEDSFAVSKAFHGK